MPFVLIILQIITTQSTRGLIVHCVLPKTFKSHTFVCEDAQSSAKLIFKDQQKYEKVELEDVEFNKMYRVMTQDQVEARYFLTTSFIERFKNLKTAFDPEYQRIEVIGNDMFIFLKTKKDCFEISSISKETTYSHFLNLFEEIYSILDLVEQLKLDQKTRL